MDILFIFLHVKYLFALNEMLQNISKGVCVVQGHL